jgi:hypothetical protein
MTIPSTFIDFFMRYLRIIQLVILFAIHVLETAIVLQNREL